MPMPEQRTYRHVDTSRSPTAIAGVEQFLRGTGGDSARMSPTYSPKGSNSPSSPYFERLKQHDPEEDPALYQKKSVLAKVKEKAKKFRNSLSKRRQEDDNVTPSWGVSLDDDEEEEDAEYLGAPMYESELAPEPYKENARQHPRANPVISEKHVLHNTVKLGVQQDGEKQRGPFNKFKTTIQPATTTTATTTPNMTSETIAQKLIPVYAGGSNTTQSLSSKIQAALSTTPPAANDVSSQTSSRTTPLSSSVPSSMRNSPSSSVPALSESKSQKGATAKDYLMFESRDDAKNVSPMQSSSSLSASLSGKNASLRSASAKDSLMSRPRDAAKTMSQPQPQVTLTPKATSPRRISSNAGVMDKVIGAVNSLLGNEESSQQYGDKIPPTRNSSQTQQVDHQEENQGRILQAN